MKTKFELLLFSAALPVDTSPRIGGSLPARTAAAAEVRMRSMKKYPTILYRHRNAVIPVYRGIFVTSLIIVHNFEARRRILVLCEKCTTTITRRYSVVFF